MRSKRRACLGARSPRPRGTLNFEGFATVDILVDEGRISAIAPAGSSRLRRRAAGRFVRAHRAAPLRRRSHPYRQGSHLAAETQSGRRLSERARRGNRRPLGQLERCRRRRADGIQPALAHTRTARRRCAPTSTALAPRRGSAGRCSPRRASAGGTGSRSKRRRSSAWILPSTDRTWPTSRRCSMPTELEFSAP